MKRTTPAVTMAHVNFIAIPRRKLSERVPGTPLQLACVGGAGGDAERREADVGAHAESSLIQYPVDEVRDVERFEKELHAASSAESQGLRRAKVDRFVRLELQHVDREGSEAARRAVV